MNTELCSYLAAQSRALERIAHELSVLNLHLSVYFGKQDPEHLGHVKRVLKAQHVEENRED